MIEKHITLSNDYDGLDDKVALNGKNFEKMCKNINKYRKIEKDKIIADLIQIYGKDKVLKCIGNGKSFSKKQRIILQNKCSIHFMQNMYRYCLQNHIAILRTEVLTPGISPEFFETIIGNKLAKDAIDGEGVTDHLFLNKPLMHLWPFLELVFCVFNFVLILFSEVFFSSLRSLSIH